MHALFHIVRLRKDVFVTVAIADSAHGHRVFDSAHGDRLFDSVHGDRLFAWPQTARLSDCS